MGSLDILVYRTLPAGMAQVIQTMPAAELIKTFHLT
jgi:hypothetical protein